MMSKDVNIHGGPALGLTAVELNKAAKKLKFLRLLTEIHSSSIDQLVYSLSISSLFRFHK